MDQLESFKAHWQRSAMGEKRFSSSELHKLLARKSSGIVRWIFYLGIGELVFFLLLGILLLDDESIELFKQLDIWTEYVVYSVFHYIIILTFIYLFYRNYKKINAVQPTRTLMKNILTVRSTMSWYVWYNIISGFVSFVAAGFYTILNDPQVEKIRLNVESEEKMIQFYAIVIGIFVLLSIVFSVILWLFYRLVYGILLKRLKNNYKELKRIEV